MHVTAPWAEAARYGGTWRCCRWFISEDARTIEDDLEQLRALFFATGEGLPKDAIDQSLARVSSLLDIMRMDTGTLIARYQVTTAPAWCAWWLTSSC